MIQVYALYILIYTLRAIPLQMAQANFNSDPYVQDFGISVDQKMVTVTGRVLPPPRLQYGGKVGSACVPGEVTLTVYMYTV